MLHKLKQADPCYQYDNCIFHYGSLNRQSGALRPALSRMVDTPSG
jgi:hypothetical protein